jgi:hypothetical protein
VPDHTVCRSEMATGCLLGEDGDNRGMHIHGIGFGFRVVLLRGMRRASRARRNIRGGTNAPMSPREPKGLERYVSIKRTNRALFKGSVLFL